MEAPRARAIYITVVICFGGCRADGGSPEVKYTDEPTTARLTDGTGVAPMRANESAAALFSDDFNRDAKPRLGASWSIGSGSWHTDGRAVTGGSGGGQATEVVTTCANCTVQASIVGVGASETGLYLRAPSPTSKDHYDAVLLASGDVQVRRICGGVVTVLAQAPSGLSRPGGRAVLSLAVSGAGPVSLVASIDGVARASASDARATALTAAGFAGMWTTGAGVVFDDFALTKPSAFQPGFHQALRRSVSTGGDVTLRYYLPIGRSGSRVRVSWVSGDAALQIYAAQVVNAAGVSRRLRFSGSEGIRLGAHQRVSSDPVDLGVHAGDDLCVTFAANGTLLASTISYFPRSLAHKGRSLEAATGHSGHWTSNARLAGITTIEVDGPPGMALVAVGDSITEGYVGGQVFLTDQLTQSFADHLPLFRRLLAVATRVGVALGRLRTNDARNAWPLVAQGDLMRPAAGAGVSGQGTAAALANLEQEVLALRGEVSDCVILLGTNDLSGNGGGLPVTQIEANLSTLYGALAPMCRVWAGTLLPKQWQAKLYTRSEYELIRRQRHELNAWIRSLGPGNHVSGVIDFERVTRRSDTHVDEFGHAPDGTSYTSDGLHPSIAGQKVMGDEVARVLAPFRSISDAEPVP